MSCVLSDEDFFGFPSLIRYISETKCPDSRKILQKLFFPPCNTLKKYPLGPYVEGKNLESEQVFLKEGFFFPQPITGRKKRKWTPVLQKKFSFCFCRCSSLEGRDRYLPSPKRLDRGQWRQPKEWVGAFSVCRFFLTTVSACSCRKQGMLKSWCRPMFFFKIYQNITDEQ